MSRRTVALIAAVALAALATVALISYIRGLEDDILAGKQPVQVFVAKEDIPAGVSGDTASQQGLIETRTVTEDVRPEGAITSLQEISGRVAAVQIFKDEIIVGARFVTPGTAASGAGLPIPQGKHAVSVQVSAPAGVAGFIQPGNQVSLIVQVNRQGRTPETSGPFVQYLLQNVDVLAVGTRVVSVGATTAGNQQQQQQVDTACCLLTLALTPVQAEQLVFAIHNGQLWFTLVPERSPVVRTPGRVLANLFG